MAATGAAKRMAADSSFRKTHLEFADGIRRRFGPLDLRLFITGTQLELECGSRLRVLGWKHETLKRPA